jgi:drug/metabolite transporter (DMT)-like permease
LAPWKAKTLLLIGTAIWGATFLFTTIGIQYCSPSLYVILRFFIALLLCVIFFRKHVFSTTKTVAKQGILLGVFFAVGFLLQTFALKYTSIGNTAFITNLCVVITPFVSYLVTRSKVKFWSKISVIIAFAGIYILTNPSADKINIGDLLVLGSTVFWSLYISFIQKFTAGKDTPGLNSQLVAFQFIGGLPILIAYFLLFDLPTFYLTINTEFLVSLGFNAVMASFVVSFLQVSVQKYTTTVNASLIFALEPIFASVISFLVLGELLTRNGFIGAGLMLLAIFVSDTLGTIIQKLRRA